MPLTIQDIYKKKLEAIKENNKALDLILVTEQERNNLITETKLLSKDQAFQISNLYLTDFTNKCIEFKLFNIKISTLERERE